MPNKFRKIRCLWLLLVILGGAARAFAGETLPPIGKRAYIVGKDRGRAPVVILRDGDQNKAGQVSSAEVMRDPVASNALPKPPGISPQVKKNPDTERRVKAASLRFQKLNISGKSSKPRVEFVQEPVRLERADEPISRDFFEKVFIPSQMDDL
jgi:hypothetical protein